MHVGEAVGRSRFQQQHVIAAVIRERGGEFDAREPTADDHGPAVPRHGSGTAWAAHPGPGGAVLRLRTAGHR
ncbi:hypothetical protein OG479_34155 [Streptomyces subrutilus]|uniref:hypothetical protein n=1 Tax=Streptomyces subrutilus TaxID=36818 RepID=UPI001674E87A|nr:hypothetical protein [Streptomyces subrutilus]WSJ33949.1 hypothetical protein OG479_34155 [Streptomyces subrutilus]